MFLLKEGERDPSPFVSASFSIPGFERKDIILRKSQYCLFLSTTGQNIGTREIQKVVFLEREFGEPWFDIEVGIDAGELWESMKRLRKTDIGSIEYWLSQLPSEVAELERKGHFDLLVYQMQREYESGLEFVGELVPKFLSRFPEYGQVIDHFGSNKKVTFIDSGSYQSAVRWDIGSGEFAVSVGEVKEVLPDEELDAFEVGGKRYWPHSWQAVWYQTESRNTTYDPNDSNMRAILLKESLSTLESYLKAKK